MNTHSPNQLFTNHTYTLFAEVLIPLALPKNFTWAVPDHLKEAVQPGIRVEVVLGKNKKYAGLVKKTFTEKPEAFNPKPILNVLDDVPLLHPEQLAFWEWIADYYMCTEGEVMQAAIPSNLKLSSETVLMWNDSYEDEMIELDDEEFMVAEALNLKKELRLNEVQQILDASHVYPVIKRLIEKQVCLVWEELKEKYKEKKETYVILQPAYHKEEALADLLNNWQQYKAPKQMELLMAYIHLQRTQGEVSQPELLKKSGATAAQLKGLVEKNILRTEKRAVDRIGSLPKDVIIDFELSPLQQQAAEKIETLFDEKQVCLLHGVTASGKTQVYVKLIEAFIRKGKQVLYMLPEIALTTQIIRRLQKHFGGNISIYHSKFNPNERVEIWNKVKSGEARIVLGARSAVFLPFRDLGLIIADEEHDSSYKQQEPAPRYHARDAAIYYASLFQAKVLLGSATPSIESYTNAQQGKYGLVQLMERYGNVAMPQIEIVDVKRVIKKDHSKVMLTPELHQAITQSLHDKKQIILFQNRRGYSPYQICGVCGWIPQCKNCDVTLTYHKSKNKLACHYCGTTYPVIYTCSACGSNRFIQKNFGTEKIEEMITEAFPDARTARMDYDSVKGKHDHDNLIKLFEQQKIDILVGTQMVVKGLDFEHVNLVGILDADGILNFADFRVNERAYQLMEQVSGRAGRKDGLGKVMIQVSNTEHPVLGFVQQHNYQQLFQYEMENRQRFFYPPFARIIQVIFKHKDQLIAEEAAQHMVNGLKKDFGPYVFGPANPVVNRIRNQYLSELLIKLPRKAPLIQQCKLQIAQQITIINATKRYSSVHIIPDIDPV
ncbi:replication restart DNA helicase PriA [Filimonas lacunae]|uniref:Replication restart protein PriA n=1 Tax=Filimonas lacunae TaxID=477680 RepID=A0A173MCQ0_9BACT|nr:primosomal protein N' [Filimonas lacunae]BAV05259.1 helicase PriA essential for oriC/DnaA-independent DNA replication [Filimonas lacunae]SIT22345.1 replication restart DNA helicase PriA [Filimonas lacunae]